MNGSAVISECKKYRYQLERRWEGGIGLLGWVMLNPSTADGTLDDPTIKRCIGFSKDWGYGGLRVCNLFALRSPEPEELLVPGAEPEGPNNAQYLEKLIADCERIVVAWGAFADMTHPLFARVGAKAVSLLNRAPGGLWCVGTTASGAPRHPLYVRADTKPVRWGQEK